MTSSGTWRSQSGAAILTAMLTVTLVATLASAALWQQWRSLEIETAERQRVQAAWILSGALDWARLILREDARTGGADHLGEPWAIALEESRLSTFLAADQDHSAEIEGDEDAFLSGQIFDLQARLNVTNLVDAGQLSSPTMRAFTKLFALFDLPLAELEHLAENLRFASDFSPDNRSAAQAPLLPQRVPDLQWLGLSARTLAVLKPYITVLPARTTVNLNTASVEVLYACMDDLDMADAQRLVSARALSHFSNPADVIKVLPQAASQLHETLHSVTSRYFEVRGRLRMQQHTVSERSVVQRDAMNVKTLWREHMVWATDD